MAVSNWLFSVHVAPTDALIGCSVPAYSQLSSSNSCTLPATFVLKLSEKMAMSAYTLDKIAEVCLVMPRKPYLPGYFMLIMVYDC